MYFNQTSENKSYFKERDLKEIFKNLFSEEEIENVISHLIEWDRRDYCDGEITLLGGISSAEQPQYEFWAEKRIELLGDGS